MTFFKHNAILFFFIVLLLHLAFIYVGWDEARLLSKLLLLPILLFHYFMQAKRMGAKGSGWIYMSLIFSFLGDLLLTQSGELFFLVGMLSFMGTHICNSVYFLKIQSLSMKRILPIGVSSVILLSIILVILKILLPYLGSFQKPIIGYMMVIGSMTVLSVNTLNSSNCKKVAMGCFIPGAAFFVVSDGLLALNKFMYHIPILDLLVMLTYGLAQYFLVCGFVKTIDKID